MHTNTRELAARYVRSYRLLLGLIAFASVALAFLPTPTSSYDPLLPRLALAAFAAAGLVGSRWGSVRRHLRSWVVVTGYLLLGWFLYVGARNGLGVDNALGLVPIVLLVPLVARSAAEVLLFLVFFAVGAALAYVGNDTAALPLPILLIVHGSLVLGLGAMSVSRVGLEEALDEANGLLERRVEQRTHALADVNHRLRQEVEVRKQVEAVATANSRAKSVFLANMSHELRTPLNAILGYAELLDEDLDEPSARADVGRIHASASHLLGLIQDILDLTKIETSHLPMDAEPLDLAVVLDEAVALTAPQLEAHGNVLVRPGSDSLWVVGDELRLRQVFVNLLSNAAKFTTDGEVRLQAGVRGDRVRVAVVDTGVGIAPELIGRVFERFVQGDDSPTRSHGGTGLGLAICRELLEPMKGTIAVESEEGVGTRFTVELPVAQAAAAP